MLIRMALFALILDVVDEVDNHAQPVTVYRQATSLIAVSRQKKGSIRALLLITNQICDSSSGSAVNKSATKPAAT